MWPYWQVVLDGVTGVGMQRDEIKKYVVKYLSKVKKKITEVI